MKKASSLLLCLSLSMITLFAQGVKFEKSSLEEAKTRATTEGKMLFVDCFTTWCGPCNWMNTNIFPLEEVGSFYNQNFVNLKLDMEKGEGLEFAKTYNIRNYPTFLFLDANGSVIHKIVGSRPADDFIMAGSNALDPTKQLYALKEKHTAGNRDAKLLKNYTQALDNAYEPYDEVAAQYIEGLSDKELLKNDNMDFILHFANVPGSKGFNSFTQNAEKYKDEFSEDAVSEKVSMAGTYLIKKAVREEDASVIANELKPLFEQLLPEKAAEMEAMAMMRYFDAVEDYENYAASASNFVEQYLLNKADTEGLSQELNSVAWNFYEVIDNPNYLHEAIKWIDRSIELESSYYNLDTKAALLLKAGLIEDGVKWANIAIEAAKKEGMGFEGTQELIQKFAGK